MFLTLLACAETMEVWRVSSSNGGETECDVAFDHDFAGAYAREAEVSTRTYTSSNTSTLDVSVFRRQRELRLTWQGIVYEGDEDADGNLLLAGHTEEKSGSEYTVYDFDQRTTYIYLADHVLDAEPAEGGYHGSLTSTTVSTERFDEDDTWTQQAADAGGEDGNAGSSANGYLVDGDGTVENRWDQAECGEARCWFELESTCVGTSGFNVETRP